MVEFSVYLNRRVFVLFFIIIMFFVEILAFNANSKDPVQTLRIAVSDLSLHCLPVSLLWDTRHKWVKAE